MAWTASLSGIARAQVDDHLTCYKVKDSLKLKGLVDISTKQFGLEPNCKIAKGILFCIPATKRVLEAFDKSTRPPTPIDPLPVFGEPAPGDRICYKIKCKKPFPEDQEVTDQFGNRIMRKLKPIMLCTPAFKGGTTTTTSTTSTTTTLPPPVQCIDALAPVCNGRCPPGEECVHLLGTTLCECREVDTFPDSKAAIDVIMPGGQVDTIVLRGPTRVEVDLGRLGDRDANGREEVPTEIVAMELTGTSPLVGPVTVRAGKQFGLPPTIGSIEEGLNLTPGVLDLPPISSVGFSADSFFDVFVEIDVAGNALHNVNPKRMTAVITHKPPAEGETYQNPDRQELYDENGNATGIFMGPGSHTPIPRQCGDTFPQCDGVCPNPEDKCVNAGERCVCQSPGSTPCGPDLQFPQCDGTCPAGQICMDVQINPAQAGKCGCVDGTDQCGDPKNPYAAPMCWGACPDPAQVCTDTAAAGCRCL